MILGVAGACAAVIGAGVLTLWLVSIWLRDVSIVDIFWGLGFVAVAWVAFVYSGARGHRALALVGLTSVWGVRLAAYLAWRNLRGGVEDRRYAAMRRRRGESFWWRSLYIVFGLQGLLILVVASPLMVGIAAYGGRDISPLGWVGVAGFIVGLTFETVGDRQLARFKSDPDNKGKVMDKGLWRYTRHPNYFGDFLVWWSLTAVASPGWDRAWVILGPLIMTGLLLKVSGVALLEADIAERRPGYADYVRRTSAFFPWPPK